MTDIAGTATQARQSFQDGASKYERAGSDADPVFLSSGASHVTPHMATAPTHRAMRSAHGPAHRSHRRTAISPAAKGPEAPATPEEAAGGEQNQRDNDNAQHIEPLLSSGHVNSLLTIIIIRMMLKSTLNICCSSPIGVSTLMSILVSALVSILMSTLMSILKSGLGYREIFFYRQMPVPSASLHGGNIHFCFCSQNRCT